MKNIKKANNILKDNIKLTEEIYDIYDYLEKGEIIENTIKLKKFPNIIRLGINNNDNNKHHSDDERGSISGSDNSDPLMDFEVCKLDDEQKQN